MINSTSGTEFVRPSVSGTLQGEGGTIISVQQATVTYELVSSAVPPIVTTVALHVDDAETVKITLWTFSTGISAQKVYLIFLFKHFMNTE